MKIYHNARCGKSRDTLALIRAAGVEPEIVEYLKTPLTADEIKVLLTKLEIPAVDLIRKGEKIFKEKYKGKEMSEADWVQAMAENPILIERPIVETDDRAVLGRPPENVQALL